MLLTVQRPEGHPRPIEKQLRLLFPAKTSRGHLIRGLLAERALKEFAFPSWNHTTNFAAACASSFGAARSGLPDPPLKVLFDSKLAVQERCRRGTGSCPFFLQVTEAKETIPEKSDTKRQARKA